jgi:amino acid adenylation domain-containing protein
MSGTCEEAIGGSSEFEALTTGYDPGATIHSLFHSVAEQRPDALALVSGSRDFTYASLEKITNQVARELARRGAAAGAAIGLLTNRSPEAIILMIAALKCGSCYAPLDAAYPGERLAMMIEDAKPQIVVADRELTSCLTGPTSVTKIALLDELLQAAADQSDEPLAIGVEATDLAYVMFTSGSTGRPKGVAVRHRAVVRLVRDQNYANFGPDEVVLHMAPLAFDASTLEIWGPLLNGGLVVILDEPKPSLSCIGETIKNHNITTSWMTAGLFHLMVDHRLEDLRGLRQLLAGGDVLSVPHVRRVLAELPDTQLINGYGPTENTTFTCCYPIPRAGWGEGSVPIGRPIAHTTVYILDDDLKPVAEGEAGQLCTGGDGVAAGYIFRPDLTEEKFRPDPFALTPSARMYLTGDIVRRRPDGLIEFFGRKDRQIKIDGKRIELDEIEAVLRTGPGVADAIVTLREDNPGQKRIVGYLRLKSGAEGEAAAAQIADNFRAAKAALPSYMVPNDLIALSAFPLNPQGKVDRAKLPAPASSLVPSPDVEPSGNDLEKIIAACWKQVLHRDSVPRNVNFFDLGGTSLQLIQIHELIRERVGPVPIVHLFDKPSIAALANHLMNRTAESGIKEVSKDRAAMQVEALQRFRPRKRV